MKVVRFWNKNSPAVVAERSSVCQIQVDIFQVPGLNPDWEDYTRYKHILCLYINQNVFFNLNSNFDQATQKKTKKAILYGKINFINAKYDGINMMSKFKAPL